MLVDTSFEPIPKFQVTSTEVVYLMEEHYINVPTRALSDKQADCSKEEGFGVTRKESKVLLTPNLSKCKSRQNGLKLDKVTNLVRRTGSCFMQVLGTLAHIGLWILDKALDFCCHQCVHNVASVILSVFLELFVVLVLATSTILTSLIINIDEAYRIYHLSRNECTEKTEPTEFVELEKTEKMCEDILKSQSTSEASDVLDNTSSESNTQAEDLLD